MQVGKNCFLVICLSLFACSCSQRHISIEAELLQKKRDLFFKGNDIKPYSGYVIYKINNQEKELFLKDGKPWDGVYKGQFKWGNYRSVDVDGYSDCDTLISYSNGKKNGYQIWYNKEYNELAKIQLENGLPKEGTILESIGDIWRITHYSSGSKNGKVIYFVSTSCTGTYDQTVPKQLKEFGIYKDNKPWDGTFIVKSQKVKFGWIVSTYKNGQIIKKELTFRYSGIPDDAVEGVKLPKELPLHSQQEE